jgi:molybdopterin-guanine dinucleotide biosynthesis protein B
MSVLILQDRNRQIKSWEIPKQVVDWRLATQIKLWSDETVPKILHIVGCKNAGKTRTIEMLLPPLKKLGLAVGTLKYTEHEGFHWDVPGKDTYRHTQAGSDITGIFGPRCWAFSDNRPDAGDVPLESLINAFYRNVDIVLVEGYRLDIARKIEVLRPGFTDRSVAEPSQLLATYGQRLYVYDIPHFEYGAEVGLARHIFEHLHDLRSISGAQSTPE